MNIGGKQFMNLQEAVGWLLQNNALPFQCNVDYVANTEIAKTTIINPSPAEIKVGALVLFADSKFGTVSGITTNGFMVGPDYTNLQDAIAYISSISINASGYLLCTLSDGNVKNAGQIKMVNNFSINGSQHLIANYNDGTSTDLGAIFTGNINIAGNLTADSIIENMSGYGVYNKDTTHVTWHYIGIVKNGNKLTFAASGKFNEADKSGTGYRGIITFQIPNAVGANLVPFSGNDLAWGVLPLFSAYNNHVDVPVLVLKTSSVTLQINLYDYPSALQINTDYEFRFEMTFLLGTNLAS